MGWTDPCPTRSSPRSSDISTLAPNSDSAFPRTANAIPASRPDPWSPRAASTRPSVPAAPFPPGLGARLAGGQAPVVPWPGGPGRAGGGGSVRVWRRPRAEPRVLRSLARCPRSLRRSPRRPPLSALSPGRSRDAAGAAKARRRLGLGRAPHWPAQRVTRPAPPRSRPGPAGLRAAHAPGASEQLDLRAAGSAARFATFSQLPAPSPSRWTRGVHEGPLPTLGPR